MESMIGKTRIFANFILISVTSWFFSCDRSDEPIPTHSYLRELDQVSFTAARDIRLAASLFDLQELADLANHDARVYRMIYKTTYKGQEIEASALVSVPVDYEGSMAIVSMHHGTLVRKSEAPSQNTSDYLLFSSVATTGLVTLIPDFLGFGYSESIFHPYYVEEWEARPVVDMIKAAAELMEDSSWTWNKKLFLAGYSEGGYVTMAAHKYIQEHPEEGLTVTASAPAAGGYDLLHMKDYFFSLESYHEPFYLSYVVLAHKTTFEWQEPLSTFFQEPYATEIPKLFDGSLGGAEINSQLTQVVRDFLNLDMLENFDTDEKYSVFKKSFLDNSLTDWVPQAPIRLYHGTDDITVPYSNTVATFEQLKENGTGDNLELVPLEGANHGSGLIPMFKDAVPWMVGMKD